MEVKKMNTKEAIEIIKQMTNAFKCIGGYKCSDINKKQGEIISLLQRDEKYEQIFKEIKDESHIGTWWEDYIKGKEQKYFPKNKATNDKG